MGEIADDLFDSILESECEGCGCKGFEPHEEDCPHDDSTAPQEHKDGE